MGKTKKDRLDDVLAGLMQVGQIKACGVVSREGLLINSRTPPDLDARIFSALCSTMMGAGEAASGQLATGTVSQISVTSQKGTIILIPAGSKAILTVFTDPEAQLGLIFFEMEIRAIQVDKILLEM